MVIGNIFRPVGRQGLYLDGIDIWVMNPYQDTSFPAEDCITDTRKEKQEKREKHKDFDSSGLLNFLPTMKKLLIHF